MENLEIESETKDYFCFCPECSSSFEILFIDDNIIEYKCYNKT